MDINQLLAEMQQAIAASEEQKKEARRNALMQASFAMMGARKGREGEALARAGMLGLGSYNANLERSRETNTDAYKLAMLQAQAQQKQAEAQRAQEQGRYVGGAMENPAEAFAATGPVPKMPPAIEQYREAARRAASLNDSAKAKTYSEIADKLEEDFNTTPHVGMVNGKPVNYLAGKRGTTKMLDVAPTPKTKVIDTKDRQFVVDEYTMAPGTEWKTGMTPSEKGNLGVANANLGLRQKEIDVKRAEVDAMREIGGGAANREVGKLVADIRKEYNSLDPVKNYRAAHPIAISAASAPDTPAGDLDLIYAVGKVLDPGSVVREGEMNLVIKSGSPLQRLQGTVRMIGMGKGRLPPEQRKELISLLNNRMTQLKGAHDLAAAPFVQQVQRMNLPVSEVFGGSGEQSSSEVVDFSQLPKGR